MSHGDLGPVLAPVDSARDPVRIVTRVPPETIGRDNELRFLDSFLREPTRGLAAALLEGDAGIGKSTLWLAGVETARNRGMRVLSSRPVEAEQSLANVGLGDLTCVRPRWHALI
jgi:hypothetical protein